jgi:Flp pilus assembly pilin Flp
MTSLKIRWHVSCLSLYVIMKSSVMTTSQVKEVSEKMKKSLRKLYRGLKQRKGQSLVEYALILALIAVVAILVLRGIGGNVNNKLIAVNANLQ